MADYLIKRDVEWLATPVPAFKGRTPREAALDPNLRPELIRLMKERIRDCDTRNLETGSNDDISWMLRDLGLNEILFDPPPPRDRVKLISTSPEDEGEEYYDEPEFLTLPPPPALPDGAWTKGEASARFEQALAAFPKITQAFDYLIEMDYPLFQDLGEIAGDLLGDREKQFLAPILSLLVLAFAPRGTCPPEIEFADLSEAFRREMTAFDNPSSNRFEDQFVEWLKRSSQPQLLEGYLSLAVTLSEQAPPNLQPGNASRTSFFIIIRVVIDELDRAMRKGY
jgi:hypothetical protein